MKQKRLAMLVGLIILIVVAYWFLAHHKASAPETNTTPAEGTENTIPSNSNSNQTSTTSTDSIAVSTQIAGTSVTIDNLNLSAPGFVAIHAVDSGGQPGAIIGTSNLISVGTKQDLEIKATIKAGVRYIALIHVDNGDGKFSAATDLPSTSPKATAIFSVTK